LNKCICLERGLDHTTGWKLFLIPVVGFLVTIFVLSIGFGEGDYIKGGARGISQGVMNNE